MNDLKYKEEMHEALKPISWLSGCWVTEEGRGSFPNLKPFEYYEALEFTCVGQPMFNYISSAMNSEKAMPMHQERGFLRVKPNTNEVAFIISHNFGVASIEEGTFDPDTKEIKLETVSISKMSFAKPPHVKSFKRTIRLVDANTLEIVLFMETEQTPLSEHLRAVYTRTDSK